MAKKMAKKNPTGENRLHWAGAFENKRTFFVLTDCSVQSNFRQGSTQKPTKYKPHYAPCQHSFIDTWGIKKQQKCRGGGCDGTKTCHGWIWWYQQHTMNQTVRCSPNKMTEQASFFFFFALGQTLHFLMSNSFSFYRQHYWSGSFSNIFKYIYNIMQCCKKYPKIILG